MTERRTTVLLVDDHAVVRQGFRMIISAEPDFEVIGEASNGREAVQEAELLQPDIVLMDVSMPELNGIEATRRIVTVAPRTRILALSMHRDSVYVREILRAGASGYLLKEAGDQDLLTAIRAVAQGQGYLSPAVSDAVLNDYRKHVTDPIDLLTSREREVLQLIAEGKTNKEIATALDLSTYTVESHRGRIMEKLNLHSAGELVRFAFRNGLIS
ncbi:MAG: response regulator [Acidobacteriota bacterium]|jgi:DNA-binding NarL/FixJ family response regulator